MGDIIFTGWLSVAVNPSVICVYLRVSIHQYFISVQNFSWSLMPLVLGKENIILLYFITGECGKFSSVGVGLYIKEVGQE